MSTLESEQADSRAKLPPVCANALEKLSADAGSQQLVKSALDLCGISGQAIPDAFPASHELLGSGAGNDKPVDQHKIEAMVNSVDRALSATFLFASTPDTRSIEKTLTESSSAERQALEKSFQAEKHKTLLEAMADVYGTDSQDYHLLKGLLLRSDSPASMAAVDVHMSLMKIDQQSLDIAKNNKGTSTGFYNNLIDNNSFSPGTAGGLDALGSLIGSVAQGYSNSDLAKLIGAMTPSEVKELESEHMRIYRRDIGDMVENTHGLSNAAKLAFKKVGIE